MNKKHKSDTDRALNLSIADGALSAVMGSLCGGVFMVGFALRVLKVSPAVIGILAAVPLFANLAQIFGAVIIEKTGRRKSLCLYSVAASRMLWLLIIFLPLFALARPGLSLILVFTSVSVFASVSGVGWLSWMSDLVPPETRGAYFGKRNMITSMFGMVFILAGGWFISYWEATRPEADPYGYMLLFGAGLASGLLALTLLRRIPEPKAAPSETVFSMAKLFSPVKDANFRKLIIFVSIWAFGINIAAPFYGVFMIDVLRLEFSQITVFATAATLATLLMMKSWGPITDKLGNKPVVTVSAVCLAAVPFLWLAVRPGRHYTPILAAHILSGAFMAGAALSQFNMLIKLSSPGSRSVYLALYAAVTGLAGAAGPVAGGLIAGALGGRVINIAELQVGGLQIIFLISSLLQAVSIAALLRVHEEGAAAPSAVFLQLTNDLNPQTGIASATDFIVVGAGKGGNILRKVDRYTESISEKSEKNVDELISKVEKAVEKPLRKIKDFLKEDEK